MRRLQLGSLLLAMAVLAACGGDGGVSSEEALRRMVLQPQDLPEAFVQADEKLTTNEHAAAGNSETRILLESWGRILGYEVTYGPRAPVLRETPVTGINVTANLYRTQEGARDAFADAAKTTAETDWAANYAGLTDFQRQEIDADSPADEIVWLRLSGFQPTADGPDALVTDDLIFFRVGRERGFLRVQASSAETEDRSHLQSTVEDWLGALVRNVQDVLLQLEDGE